MMRLNTWDRFVMGVFFHWISFKGKVSVSHFATDQIIAGEPVL